MPPNILKIYVCIKSSALSDYLALFRILTTRELANLFCVCDCCIVGLTRCLPHAPPTRAYVALTLPSPCVDYLIIGFVYGKKRTQITCTGVFVIYKRYSFCTLLRKRIS